MCRIVLHLDPALESEPVCWTVRCAGHSAGVRGGAARTGAPGQPPSHRWRKAKARVAALHTRVANQRRDGLHKLTTRLVREHDTIVIEDLQPPPRPRDLRAGHRGGNGYRHGKTQIMSQRRPREGATP